MSDTEFLLKSEPPRRLEVFTGAGRRRSWTPEQKARIVAECERDGGSGERRCATARLDAAAVVWMASRCPTPSRRDSEWHHVCSGDGGMWCVDFAGGAEAATDRGRDRHGDGSGSAWAPIAQH